MSTHSWLGEALDVFSLCVSDKVMVEDHIRLQAHHLPFCRHQYQCRIVVGEVVTEELGICKMPAL